MLARLRYALALVVIATPFVLGAGDPASAHGDEGTLTVVTAEQEGDSSIRLVVGLLYENDDELATDATVSVTATGPDGTSLPATPLPRLEGSKYGATLAVPATGSWTLQITSSEPTATATATVDVTATASSTTRLADPTTTTTAATGSGSTAKLADPPTGANASDPDATPADDDDSGRGMQLAIALAAASAVVVLAFMIVARRRTPPET